MLLDFVNSEQAAKNTSEIKRKKQISTLIKEGNLLMIRLESALILILRNIFTLEEIFWRSISSKTPPWNAQDTFSVDLNRIGRENNSERGDVPGWVLVVLMTAGLVTGIWTVAAPRLNLILRNSLDSMNAIR